MLTFQDYLQIGDSDRERAQFVRDVITQHCASPLYITAAIAEEYDRGRNKTTMEYQKRISDVYGQLHDDTQATVHRCTSNFFSIFTSQLNQYLLGNGVTWKGDVDLGNDFDTQLQKAGKYALVGGVSFGFWNLDHLEVFKVTEFAPLYDEYTGGLAAAVRFWQIDGTKPLRATFFEPDGCTDYLWTISKDSKNRSLEKEWTQVAEDTYMLAKRPYKLHVAKSNADGTEILNGENYPSFPVVPLWGNPNHQSELVGMREKIDAYDFVLNGWEDDLDTAQLYWIISGAGGMDDVDLTKFLERLRTVHAAAPEDGQQVTANTVEIPTAAREALLSRLEVQLYRDAMIMNPEFIQGGAITATQILAAYERQNIKTDQFEYCVNEFVNGILEIAGKKADFTFTRSRVVNSAEEIQTVVMAAQWLGSEYVTRKILTLLGDGDQAEEVLKAVDAEAQERLQSITEEVIKKLDSGGALNG